MFSSIFTTNFANWINRELTNKVLKEITNNKEEENNKKLSTQHEVSRNYLLLACAYASNIGGTGVITGSPPNLVVLSVLNKDYGEGKAPLSYATWMAFCVPLMVLNVILG